MKNNREPKKPKKESLELTETDIKPVTLSKQQSKYLSTILSHDITFCYGPAGTSKTFTACLAALKLYLSGKVSRIILAKPIQEAGENLGFLPGDIREKVEPYKESYKTNLVELLNPTWVEVLEMSKILEFKPLAYMRGATFKNAIIVLDEAQNANFKQLMLFITRLGHGSKAIICGDVSQYDLLKNQVAMPEFIKMLNGISGIAVHKFEKKDIVRHEILIEITERYEEWKEKNPDHRFLK